MSNSNSRTVNVARNVLVSIICQAVATLMQFIGRAVFVNILGKDYLGISGLFTNVLTVLSFAELGIGNAMIFSMYKPLAENNTEKLKSLMALYKTSYRYIGIFIAAAGLCVIPFFDFVIRDKPAISENLVLIYLLYLFNSASSYFIVYKKSIIIADQRVYVVNIFHQAANIIQVLLQIAILLLTHSFIAYLVIQIVLTFLNNMVTAKKADKMYPFLSEESKPLPTEEKKGIFKNIAALAAYKFGSTVLNGTDNIIIAALLSVGDVGIASNYVMINSAFSTLLGRITDAFTASVGNLNVHADKDKKYRTFKEMFFLSAWMFGFVSVGILLFADDVVLYWIGKEYIIQNNALIALTISFYVASIQYAAYAFRTTSGIFVEGKMAPIAATVLNIILSVVMGKRMGLCGIFYATAISRFCTISVVDGVLIYNKIFHVRPAKYFSMYFGYFALFAGMFCGIKKVIAFVPIGGITGLIIKILAVSVLFNLIMIAAFARTEVFKELLSSVRIIISKKRRLSITE